MKPLSADTTEPLRLAASDDASHEITEAMIMARNGIPSGMVFVRCRGGISHSPAEYASTDDLAAGTEVLIRVLRELAY